ncbi:hypothetical protein HanRHA438_Chr16g0760141 [Helianthus annuus]|nr:hypothetical protein HanRHA438_Chr16g0760141 [Helianthus annuus]
MFPPAESPETKTRLKSAESTSHGSGSEATAWAWSHFKEVNPSSTANGSRFSGANR